jgi:general secretion pathway protein G
MVELVFIIVILGILASIAVPRLAASRDDAVMAKGKADVAAIRSSIIMKRNQELLAGNPKFPDLNATAFSSSTTKLFDGVLDYPIDSGSSGWRGGNDNTEYFFRIENADVKFVYNSDTGIFTCVNNNGGNSNLEKLCAQLTQ